MALTSGISKSPVSPAQATQLREHRILPNEKTVQLALALIEQGAFEPELFFKERQSHEANQATRLTIAKIVAGKNGALITKEIGEYGIQSQKLRAEVAAVAASQNAQATSAGIANYGITSEQLRAGIAKIAAAKNGAETSRLITKYDIKNQGALLEIAKIAAAQNGWGVSIYIQNYGLLAEQSRIEVAKLAAAQDGQGTSEEISNYSIKDQGALAIVAATALKQHLFAAKFIQNYGLDHAREREALDGALRSLASTSAAQLIKSWQNIRSEIQTLSELSYCPQGIDCPAWADLEPHKRVASIARWVQRTYGLDESLLDYERDLSAQELGARALAAALITWHSTVPDATTSRARKALATLSGYDIPSNSLSSQGARDLYGSLFTAIELMQGRPAEEVPLDLSVNRPQALRLLTLAATLRGLQGEIPAEALRGEYSLQTEHLTRGIEKRFEDLFAPTTLPSGSVQALIRQLGDILPLTVLTARYASTTAWHRALPSLKAMVNDVLSGKFHERRYSREDNQLAFLKDQQLVAWRQNPILFALGQSASRDLGPQAPVREQARELFEKVLAPRLTIIADEPRSTALHSDQVRALLQLSESERAKELKSLSKATSALWGALYAEDLREEELKALLGALNSSKRSFLAHISDEDLRKQLGTDLQSLKDLCTPRSARAHSEYYILSTVTDDPGLLLRTGDLVQTASCQNFRSGGHIDTLMGNVVDGNIKLALSFVMKRERFDAAVEGLKGALQVSFDPARTELVVRELNASDPGEVRLQLGYAMRRELLRLGESKVGTTLLVERAYTQSHPLSSAIEAQQRALVSSFGHSVGAQTAHSGMTVRFPASRNIPGVYSDKAGGIKTGPYSIRC